jgi:hypothetical protein
MFPSPFRFAAANPTVDQMPAGAFSARNVGVPNVPLPRPSVIAARPLSHCTARSGAPSPLRSAAVTVYGESAPIGTAERVNPPPLFSRIVISPLLTWYAPAAATAMSARPSRLKSPTVIAIATGPTGCTTGAPSPPLPSPR